MSNVIIIVEQTIEFRRLNNHGLHCALKCVLHAFQSVLVIERFDSHLQHRVSTRLVIFSSMIHISDACVYSLTVNSPDVGHSSSLASSFRILAFNFLLCHDVPYGFPNVSSSVYFREKKRRQKKGSCL